MLKNVYKHSLISRKQIRFSTVTVLKSTNFEKQLWVNGKGTTYEVDRHDGDNDGAQFRHRISMADLTNGSSTFSQIPGIDRILILLQGQGVELTISGQLTKRLKLHEPFLFPADVDCHCTVESQDGKDLNIMYERERCNGFVSILDGENTSTQVPCGTSETFVIALGNETEIQYNNSEYVIQDTEAIKISQPKQQDIITVANHQGKACVVCFVPSPKYM